MSNHLELKRLYLSLNPAELKRDIDAKLKELYRIYQDKNNSKRIGPFKKQAPRVATKSYILNDSTTPASISYLNDLTGEW